MEELLNLCRGERVVVRSESEILATLDAKGELDALPFMPEMLGFCGQHLVVDQRSDKTCDTISGDIVARRMRNTVHLVGARCDGGAHGGCQADCLLYWKEAWLERVETPRSHPLWPLVAGAGSATSRPQPVAGGSPDRLDESVVESDVGESEDAVRYRCQATRVLAASEPLSAQAPGQYLRDWLSGNVALGYMLKIALLRLLRAFVVRGRGFSLKVKLYDALARVFGEPAWPFSKGRLSGRTPRELLELQPGDLVTVRSHGEILDTLNEWSNRGLSFTPEMVRYCGGTFRVRSRVERIVDEKTGRMLRMKGDCIVLEDVVCRSECSTNRLFCPRAIYPYWREIWLRRADDDAEAPETS